MPGVQLNRINVFDVAFPAGVTLLSFINGLSCGPERNTAQFQIVGPLCFLESLGW